MGGKHQKKQLFLMLLKVFLKFPSLRVGISIRDFEKWKKIFLSVGKDSEILRNAQFILQQRIFLDIIKRRLGSDLSVFFTNHVASCLHRNFHNLNKNYKGDIDKKKKSINQ